MEAVSLEKSCHQTIFKESGWPSIERITNEFNQLIASLALTLQDRLPATLPPSSSNNDIDLSLAMNCIGALDSALESGEPPRVKKHFNELLGELGSSRTQALRDSIDCFDYELALVRLKQIKERL